MVPEAFERMKKLLLEELENPNREWWVIFSHRQNAGALVYGHGPTDAWRLAHDLKLLDGGSTSTIGPVAEVAMVRVPMDKRWVMIPREELDQLGK
jgi:hypothetical protein